MIATYLANTDLTQRGRSWRAVFTQPCLSLFGEHQKRVQPSGLWLQEAGFFQVAQGGHGNPFRYFQMVSDKVPVSLSAGTDETQNLGFYIAEGFVLGLLLLYAAKVISGRIQGGLKIFRLRIRAFKLRLQLVHRRLKSRYLLFRLNRTLAALKRLRQSRELDETIPDVNGAWLGIPSKVVDELVDPALEGLGRHDAACKSKPNLKQ